MTRKKTRATMHVDPSYKNWYRKLKHRINAKLNNKELSDRDLSKIMSNTIPIEDVEKKLIKQLQNQTKIGFKIKLDGSMLK